MEEGRDRTQPAKTFVSRFRVGEAHFTVDLQNELRLFPADVILCLDPVPNFSLPAFAGLALTEVKDGPLTRITGGRCTLLYTIDPDTEIDTNMLRYWFGQIKDFGLRRVLVTEPYRQEQTQLFVSNLVDAGLDFLGKVDKSEVIFTTFTSGLYEHAFSILARQQRPAYEEGNGIIDDDDLLRRLYNTLQCHFCAHMHPNVSFTSCCKRLKCKDCVTRSPTLCQQCRLPCSHAPAPMCSKIVRDTLVTCVCSKQFTWSEFDTHMDRCESIMGKCPICACELPRSKLLKHASDKHEDWLLDNFSMTIGVKEFTILQKMNEPVLPPRPQNWKCACGNMNQPHVQACINCQLMKPL